MRFEGNFVLHRLSAITPNIMVCYAILYGSRRTLMTVRTTLTTEQYFDDILLLFALRYMICHPVAILKHNNARPHLSLIPLDFLRFLQTLLWPERSLDI